MNREMDYVDIEIFFKLDAFFRSVPETELQNIYI